MTCSALCLALGLTAVSSTGLGYDSPYAGAVVRADVEQGRFVVRVEASYLMAEKLDTGDGHGVSAHAVGGVRFGIVDVLAGYEWSQQTTSAYTKDAGSVRAELGVNGRLGRAAAIYSEHNGREAARSYGIRVENASRFGAVLEAERVSFTSYFGERHTGERIALSYLWRF